MKETMIESIEIKKSYGKHEVLKGVNFSIQKGEIFALLGSNGAGKTTMIKILSTLIKQDGGEATVCGFDTQKQSHQVKESIRLTGQFAAVDEILTGSENLQFIAKLCHLPNPKQAADEMLARFHLEDAKDQPVGTYSGGMRRRLDISMSLLGNPKVIFLDEPTTGLDPEARIDVWHEIKQLTENGTTVCLTTQYLEEAEQLADQIAILHDGKIIANGTLAQLKGLFPPKKIEYIEKQPSLEEIFLAIINKKEDL